MCNSSVSQFFFQIERKPDRIAGLKGRYKIADDPIGKN
jgi:hypothetical protein